SYRGAPLRSTRTARKEIGMDKLLLRVEEAAALASVSRTTGYELVASGQWPSVQIGRARRVPRPVTGLYGKGDCDLRPFPDHGSEPHAPTQWPRAAGSSA